MSEEPGSGIMGMILNKVKPLFDKKIDEAKKEILAELKEMEERIKNKR